MGSSWGCAGVECDRGGSEAKGSSVDHDKRCLTKFNNRWQLQFTAWRRRPSQDICANTEIIIMTCSPRQGQDVVEQCSGPWRGAWPGRGNETERGQRQCPSLVASRNGMQIALSGSKSCKGDLMTHLAVLPLSLLYVPACSLNPTPSTEGCSEFLWFIRAITWQATWRCHTKIEDVDSVVVRDIWSGEQGKIERTRERERRCY